MPSALRAEDLDLIASFFEERVETVTLKNGGTAFVQRPKGKAEDSVQSATDLPDDFDIASISANSVQIYRISIAPIDIINNFDPTSLGIEIIVKLFIPFIGGFEIGRVGGSLKYGVSRNIDYKGLVNGEVGVRLDGNKAILYWDFNALGNTRKDESTIFTI